MKHSFNITEAAASIVPDKISRNAYILGGIGGIIAVPIILFFLNRLPSRIPLLLTNPWGEGRLVEKQWLLGAPLLIIVVVIVNLALAKSWNGGALVPRILAIGAATVAVMIYIALGGVLQSLFL